MWIRVILFFVVTVMVSHRSSAMEDDGVLPPYMVRVQQLLKHPKMPLYIGACAPQSGSDLSDYSAIAVVFMGTEGWVISIDRDRGDEGFWIQGTLTSISPGQMAGWEWSSGGVWIFHQIWPITRQLGREGLRPVSAASVDMIEELAKRMPCDAEPWPTKEIEAVAGRRK